MNKKTGAVIFIFITLVISILVSLVFILNINQIVNNKSRDNVYHNTDETIRYVDNYIDISYKDIEEKLNGTSKTENDLVDYLYQNNEDSRFDGFGYYDTEVVNGNLKGTLNYYKGKGNYTDFSFQSSEGGSTYLYIREERVLKQKVSLVKLSYVFENVTPLDDRTVIFYTFDDTYFAFQSFDQYANLLSKPYGDDKGYYIIMSDDGMIYENKLNHYTNIRELFSTEKSTTDYTKEAFGNNNTLIRTINGNQYIVTYVNLVNAYNTDKLFMLYFVPSSYLSDFSKSILQATLIYIAVFSLAISFLALFFFINHVRFKRARTGFALLPYSYITHYVLLVNEDGKIISRNKKFADSPFACKSILEHDIIELAGDESKIKDLLENGATLTLEPKEKSRKENGPKYIKFLIIKTKSGYQLVGTDSDEKPYIPKATVSINSSNNKNNNNSVSEYAFIDDTYQIKNRKALYIYLDEIILKKAKKEEDLYMFYCGLKSRAEIVKTYGKQINEEVNKKLIETLHSLLEPGTELYIIDSAYIIFFVRLKDNYNALNALMEDVKKRFKIPIKVYANEMIFDTFFGVYPFSGFAYQDGITPKRLIEKASFAYDKALTLKDKNFFLYDVQSESILERDAQTLIDLSGALERGELQTVFQPVYSIKDDKVSGFECLLRWTNEKYRNESIFEFIKIAEQTGLIHEIGFWTINQSLQLLKEIGKEDLRVSINVSPAQFLQAGFANKLIDTISEYNIPFNCIAIEITESFFMDSMQEVVDKLQYIRGFGVKVYLDDFGTGYSSLMYLAELPVDVIKIDKGFTNQIQTNKQVKAILTHLLAMANELHIDIVAEGVENEAQLKFYEKQKANFIQGYYFSKPVPKAQAREAIYIKRMKEED